MRLILSGEAALRQMFSAHVESTFQAELGIADPALTDYLAELLQRFLHADTLLAPGSGPSGWTIDSPEMSLLENERFGDLTALVAAGRHCEMDSEAAIARTHCVHRHIGDVALYCCGVFPATSRSRTRQQRDALLNLPGEGSRSYEIASLSCPPHAPRLIDVLRRLADQFELCCEGLKQVRRQWERLPQEQLRRRAG